MKRLSKAQVAVLRKLAEPERKMILKKFPAPFYPMDYWSVSNPHTRILKGTAEALIRLGMVDHNDGTITEAGRRYLHENRSIK